MKTAGLLVVSLCALALTGCALKPSESTPPTLEEAHPTGAADSEGALTGPLVTRPISERKPYAFFAALESEATGVGERLLREKPHEELLEFANNLCYAYSQGTTWETIELTHSGLDNFAFAPISGLEATVIHIAARRSYC